MRKALRQAIIVLVIPSLIIPSVWPEGVAPFKGSPLRPAIPSAFVSQAIVEAMGETLHPLEGGVPVREAVSQGASPDRGGRGKGGEPRVVARTEFQVSDEYGEPVMDGRDNAFLVPLAGLTRMDRANLDHAYNAPVAHSIVGNDSEWYLLSTAEKGIQFLLRTTDMPWSHELESTISGITGTSEIIPRTAYEKNWRRIVYWSHVGRSGTMSDDELTHLCDWATHRMQTHCVWVPFGNTAPIHFETRCLNKSEVKAGMAPPRFQLVITDESVGPGGRPLAPIRGRLDQVHAEILGGGETSVDAYSRTFHLSPDIAETELEWLSSLDRQTDGSGYYGVDRAATPEGAVYRRVAVDPSLFGGVDMRGPVSSWTDNTAFYVGLTVGYYLRDQKVDAAFNMTGGQSPAEQNGIRWSFRASRKGESSVAYVGEDARPSSPPLKKAFILGLRTARVVVTDLGMTSSPDTYVALALPRGPFNTDSGLPSTSFPRSFVGQEAQGVYRGIPSRDSAAPLRALQERRVIEQKPLAELYQDTEVRRRHAAWISGLVRLGPDLMQALFDHWARDQQNLGGLLHVLEALAWPQGRDADFWQAARRDLELPADLFMEQPAMALAHPLQGLAIETNDSDGAMGAILRALDATIQSGAHLRLHFDGTDFYGLRIFDETGKAITGPEMLALLSRHFPGRPLLADVTHPQALIEYLRERGHAVFQGPVGCHFYIETALLLRSAIEHGNLSVRLFPDSPQPLDVTIANLQPLAIGIELSGNTFLALAGYINDVYFLAALMIRDLALAHAQGETLQGRVQALPKYSETPAGVRIAMTRLPTAADAKEWVAAVADRVESLRALLSIHGRVDRTDGVVFIHSADDGAFAAKGLLRVPASGPATFSLIAEGTTLESRLAMEELMVAALADTEVPPAHGGPISVDFAHAGTTKYLRESPADTPSVLARIQTNPRLWNALSSAAQERVEAGFLAPYETARTMPPDSVKDWLGLWKSISEATSVERVRQWALDVLSGREKLFPPTHYARRLYAAEKERANHYESLMPGVLNGQYSWHGMEAPPEVSWFTLLDYAFFLVDLLSDHYRTGLDPYAEGNEDRIQQGVPYLEKISADPARNPELAENHVEAVRRLLYNVLYANKYEGTADFSSQFEVPWNDAFEAARYIVEEVGPDGIVDLFVDNVGPELAANFELAGYLAEYGLAGQIRFHLKAEPFSVSDVWGREDNPREPHINQELDVLSRSQIAQVRNVADRVQTYAEGGAIRFQADTFLSRMADFRRYVAEWMGLMPETSLVVVVGDNLYRKVFGNRAWQGPWHTFIREVIEHVLPRLKSPLLLVRGVKSSHKLGIHPDTPMDKTRGVIQFFRQPGAPATRIAMEGAA